MKIELATIICRREEMSWLDFGLESILGGRSLTSRHDITVTLYLARYTQEMFDGCTQLANRYPISLDIRGDNCPIDYVNETKHIGFDLNGADCVASLHPDVIFMQKHKFDDALDEASEYFDSNYAVYVSSDSPKDSTPMGITIHTKLGWEKLGCEDINFYPCAGVEHDYHRRAYLAYGLDPNDIRKYSAPLDGVVTPDWIHRVRAKGLVHLGHPVTDPRISVVPSQIDYANHIFHHAVLDAHHMPYHALKWGGFQPEETFLIPFDDDRYDNKIEWKNHDNPYPYHDTPPILRGLLV